MLPSKISQKLAGLRRWESCLRIFWGVGRWIAVVLGVLAFACLTDWLIDRFLTDTPWAVRIFLFVTQIILGLALIYFWLVCPLIRQPSDEALALMVEEKSPPLQHRLISVIQFSRLGAVLTGMSTTLIAQVTRETENQTASLNFSKAADGRRLGWATAIVLPALLVGVIVFLIWPETISALLARQLLQDVAIPRSVYLVNATEEVLPKDESVILRYRVSGKGWYWPSSGDHDPDERNLADLIADEVLTPLPGYVSVYKEGLPTEAYELEFESFDSTKQEATYIAKLPPGSENFDFRAWLGDGRSAWADVRFEPRPVVQEIVGWTLLPETCGARPFFKNQQLGSMIGMTPAPLGQANWFAVSALNPSTSGRCRYPDLQPDGEITAIPHSLAHVHVKMQKSVEKAQLKLSIPTAVLSNAQPIASSLAMTSNPQGPGMLDSLAVVPAYQSLSKKAQRKLHKQQIIVQDMTLLNDKDEAEVIFPVNFSEADYEIHVEDEYQFHNTNPPIRTVHVIPEPPPSVEFLPTRFVPLGPVKSQTPIEFRDPPVRPGGQFRVAYKFDGPYGVGAAVMYFRVWHYEGDQFSAESLKGAGPWFPFPLIEVQSTPDSGKFLWNMGVFAKSNDEEQVPFHAVPSPNPQLFLGRKFGGGRFDFSTSNLPDGKGGFAPLKPGDQIEFYIKVFADRNLSLNRPTAQTETRVVTVKSHQEFTTWLFANLNEFRRIQRLATKQRSVEIKSSPMP